MRILPVKKPFPIHRGALKTLSDQELRYLLFLVGVSLQKRLANFRCEKQWRKSSENTLS